MRITVGGTDTLKGPAWVYLGRVTYRKSSLHLAIALGKHAIQFMFGVGGYIIARVLAILLPLFFVNQPGQEDLAIRIVLILENVVLWGFLGALAYIFRYPCLLYSHA